MRDTERARRFILTGGPGDVKYGETPRSVRGFEPVRASAYPDRSVVVGQQQQLSNLRADNSNSASGVEASQLPGALRDIATWQARQDSASERRKAVLARLRAARQDGQEGSGVLRNQLHDHQGYQGPIVAVIEGGKV